MYRQQNNGTAKVNHGKIIYGTYLTLEEVDEALIRFRKATPGYDWEFTGTEGDYKIIRRDKEATASDYIKRK